MTLVKYNERKMEDESKKETNTSKYHADYHADVSAVFF